MPRKTKSLSSDLPPGPKMWDKDAWTGAKFFFSYLRPHLNVFVPALIALACTAFLTLQFVNYLSQLFVPAFAGTTGPELMNQAADTAKILVALAASQAFIAFFRILLFAKAAERALSALRLDVFSRIIRLPMAILSARRSGELASRLANDVEAVRETLVVTIPMMIRHGVMLTGALIYLLAISVKLAFFMVATLPVVMILIAIFGARIRKLTRRAQDELAGSQVVVDESLQAITSVKAFANEAHEEQRYRTALGSYLATAIQAAGPRASFIAFIIFSFSVALTLVAWFALGMISRGELSTGAFGQFAMLSAVVVQSFGQLPDLIAQFQRALGATDRVREILCEQPEPHESSSSTAPLPHFRGEIEMRHVHFAYPTRPDVTVLTDFNLRAQAGQRIALVGPSGSGKSTAVGLLFRFYEPVSGEILIDGLPINDMPLSHLRRNLALVPQEVLLFGGSIRENIAYGKPTATPEEIESAAVQANADGFIRSLPLGYDTLVGERGTQLSGGQRQRIAIARAILADPAILILDEATSSLDAESERLVQEALDKLMQNRTSIIIAHRLSTVRTADQILVLSAGTVLERGTHEELMSNGKSLYATLATLQLG
jgi:ATP-binding cassette, subfamily B, bacterial